MRAAILETTGAALVIDEVEAPSELAYGQVRVRVEYTGICGSQLGEIDGVKGPDAYLPHLLGHEGAGVVLEAGPGVKTVAAGDHVVLHWKPGAGIEADPAVYSWRGKQLNSGRVTTFNSEAVVSENRVTTIPDDFDLELASLLGCAVTTGLGVVTNDADLEPGESVVIFGAGGVGLSMVQAAALVSATPIVAVDLHDSKLELARQLGATHTINSANEDAAAAIRSVVGAGGADVVIENTGNTDVISLAYGLTSGAGRTILVGVPRVGDEARLFTLPLHFGKVLTGSHGGDAHPDRDIPRCLELVRAGKLDLQPLITARYELDAINDAIDDMRAGRIAGRCSVRVHGAG